MKQQSKQHSIRVGLFGIGLDTYWPQFDGLRERLVAYQNQIAEQLARPNVHVVNCGLIDNPHDAHKAAEQLKREDVSLIFLYVSTYALSATVLPVVQKLNVPVIVLNLQPVAAIDYSAFNALGDRRKMTGEWLAHCQACTVPEIANVFRRTGIDFHQVTGVLQNDPIAWNEIFDWIDAARVAETMRKNRVGLLGHYYSGMLDIYSDLTRHSAKFGNHFEFVEMSELRQWHESVTKKEILHKTEKIEAHFDVQSDCASEEIRRAAQTAVALDKLVEKHDLGSLAYFCNGTGDDAYVDLIGSVIVGNSLLTARGIPVAGEYEVKNVQAMKILDTFGVGGSFTEFYAFDFNDDVVLLGHDGPGHIAIAEGKTKLRPLSVYHGKTGHGLSVEMRVKTGPITLLSVIDAPDGDLRLLIAEGETVPGQILEIGNTNSRYRFPLPIREFMKLWCKPGPAHHCAVGVGHVADKLKRFAALLKIETIEIC
ncbi:MAG: arabinose isomerase [Thermoguttaceae bacterium]